MINPKSCIRPILNVLLLGIICLAITYLTIETFNFFWPTMGSQRKFIIYQQPYLFFALSTASFLISSVALFDFSDRALKRILILASVAAMGFTIFNTFYPFIRIMEYGDAGYLARTIPEGRTFSRWLGGTFLLTQFYKAFGLDLGLSGKDFIRLSSALFMLCTSLYLISRLKPSFKLILVLGCPIYLVFSIGYDEYYPFIVGLLLSTLLVFYQNSFKSGPLIPALAGTLPLFYIAYAPLAALLLFRYLLSHPRQTFMATAFSGAIYFVGIFLAWPKDLYDYWGALKFDLNLGDLHTAHGAYVNKVASDHSPFFSLDYAFSFDHLRDKSFMLLFGTGWAIPTITLFVISILLFSKKISLPKFDFNFLKGAFFGIFLIWQTYYFIFMIPKLGPYRDVDLFFSFYLALSFVAGVLLDKAFSDLSPQSNWSKTLRIGVISVVCASNISTFYFLAFIGN